jgi:hypothetical protein
MSYIHQNNLKKERGRRHSCNNPAAIFDLSQSKIISIIMEDKKTSETNRGKRRSVAGVVEIHTKNCENHTQNGEKHTIKKINLTLPR